MYCTYQLHIQVKKDLQIQIGKLGLFDFPKGHYIYTGSAKKNIDARVKRHLSDDKKLRWHIDYLLINKDVEVTDVKYSKQAECKLNQSINDKIIVKGFGASDCKQACQSHLKRL